MTPVVEVFRYFASRYSRARRDADRMGAQGNRDQIDDAIGNVQEIENEVGECFVLVRRPEKMETHR
jgi:hypothetical protein